MYDLSFVLADVDPANAGQVAGKIVAIAGSAAGALKCYSISRRPETNSKCALSLMFLLVTWCLSSLLGMSREFLLLSPAAAFVLGLLAFSLVVIAIVLAIVLGAIGWWALDTTAREPVYAGKPLGFWLDSLGHGSGVNPWEAPYFSPQSKDQPVVLKEGMAFNLEPYAGKPGIGGIRLENDHIVTKDGVDIYTTYPFDERLVNEVHPLDATTGRTR